MVRESFAATALSGSQFLKPSAPPEVILAEFRQPSEFLNKLKEKKQTGMQQKQAHESIGLFYELLRQEPDLKEMLCFVNQKHGKVKNNEKTDTYLNDTFKVPAALALSKDGTKKSPDSPVKKLQINEGQTHYSWQNIFTGLNNSRSRELKEVPESFKSPRQIAKPLPGCRSNVNDLGHGLEPIQVVGPDLHHFFSLR